MRTKERCACGLPLHYKSPEEKKEASDAIASLGEFIPVHFGSDRYLVQRHYMNLHGINNPKDLPELLRKGYAKRG